MRNPNHWTQTLAALLVIFLCLLTGCDPKTAQQKSQPEQSQYSLLSVYSDTSGSAVDEPAKDFAGRLWQQVPGLAARYEIKKFRAYAFGQDGWGAAEVLNLDFPATQKQETGEAGLIFSGMNKAAAEKGRAVKQERVAALLAGKDSGILFPSALPARCTDLNGLFRRLAQHENDSERKISIIITDGHESCRTLETINAVSRTHSIIVVLLPEKKNSKEMRDQEFEQRSAEITRAVPGVIIIPAFGDPVTAVSRAAAMSEKLTDAAIAKASPR